MLSLDPIRPYLWLLKAGAALAIASALFVSGCNHGKRNQAAEDLAEMDGLRHDLLVASTALQQASGALQRVSDATKVAQAAADRQAKAAAQAVIEATARAKALNRELAEIERDLEEALAADPDCRKLLETPSCAAFR